MYQTNEVPNSETGARIIRPLTTEVEKTLRDHLGVNAAVVMKLCIRRIEMEGHV